MKYNAKSIPLPILRSASVRKRWRNSFYRKMHIYIYCSTYKYIMSLLCSEDFLHFGSRGGLEIYGLFRDGVDELYAASQQRDAAVGVTAARTVFQVALYRCSGKGQLCAYLVLAPGEQFHFEQGVAFPYRHSAVFEHAFLLVLVARPRAERLVEPSVGDEVIGEAPFRQVAFTLYERPIGFMYFPFAQHVVEARQRFGSLCEDNESADGAVYTVHHAAEHVSGLIVFLFEILFDCLRQGGVAGLVALHDLSGTFVDNYYMIVFVERSHL